ncbi:DUF1566 domain-containing protein [Desulfobacula sp.]|uniref:Lcl C-terminal domain-containing protein n=1 Tax=Desulfobacula sp. TaxID=2593537 RepID=UPI0026323E07|nr:DUF1566 domain-containing protein [Desulfobacula sp.]
MRKIFLIIILSLFVFCSTGYAELIDNGDGTVTDTKTGLMWQKAVAGTKTWEAALAYCETLGLAGHSDWRLPNRSELKSLFDSIYDNPSINKTVFPDAMSSGYWSSDAYADNTDYAWAVYFGDGDNYAIDKHNSRDMRAVRSVK